MTEYLLSAVFLLTFLLITVSIIHYAPLRKVSFFDNSPEPVARISFPDLKFVDCNNHFLKRLDVRNKAVFLAYNFCLPYQSFDPLNGEIYQSEMKCMDENKIFPITFKILNFSKNAFIDILLVEEAHEIPDVPVPCFKLSNTFEILAENSAAIQNFGSVKNMHVSRLLEKQLQARIMAIIHKRANLHSSFCLAVRIKNGGSKQRWHFKKYKNASFLLSCESNLSPQNLHLYEDLIPDQTIEWALDDLESMLRYALIGNTWQENFSIEKDLSLKAWFALVHPADVDKLRKKYVDLFDHKIDKFRLEYRVANKNGLEYKVCTVAETSHTETNQFKVNGLHQLINFDLNAIPSHHDLSTRPENDEVGLQDYCQERNLALTDDANNKLDLLRHHVLIKKLINSFISQHDSEASIGLAIDCKGSHLSLKFSLPGKTFKPRHLQSLLKFGSNDEALVGTQILNLDKLLQSLGGSQSLKVVGDGLEQTLYVPLTQQTPIASNPLGSEILIVDDQKMVLHYLYEVLTSEGYLTTSFSDPLSAMAVFELDPYRFDLVVTDQNMVGLSGTELIRKLLLIRPDLPIVICSGGDLSLEEADALASGAIAYFPKPLDTDAFLKLCGHHLQRKLALSEDSLA